MTRKEFLYEVVNPMFLKDLFRAGKIGDAEKGYLNLILKHFKGYEGLLTGYLNSILKGKKDRESLKNTYNLSEEQIKDYLNPHKIERDYMRILWKDCKKVKNKIKIINKV